MKKRLLIIFISLIILLSIIILIYLFLKKDIIIRISEENPYYVNINDDFIIPQGQAFYCNKYFKKNCKDVTNYLNINNNVNEKAFGNYEINYSISYKNIKNNNKLNVIVSDLEAPIITLDNYEKKYICPNYNLDNFEDYKVSDNYDSELNDKVIKSIKDGKLYYSVTDSHGNKGETSVDIEISDKETPNLTLNGNEDIYLLQGTEYKEPGATAYDTCDGNLTSKIVISGELDINKIGEYKITYYVEDSSKNKQIKTRTIHIYNNSIGKGIEKNGKIIYLTFDDGPNAYTRNILNVLKKYQVKATFFVTNQFPSYQGLIKEIYEDGHSLAIHTYSHQYKNIYSSEEDYFNDLNKMDNIIYDQVGIHTKLVRFPGGSSNTISKFNPGIMTRLSDLLNEKGYKYFDWNIDSGDTSTINSNKIADNVINGIQNKKNSVVLMHDIKYANKEALEKIIYYGLTNGYTFLPLDEDSPTVHHSINN